MNFYSGRYRISLLPDRGAAISGAALSKRVNLFSASNEQYQIVSK